jgi:hypothetical protein
MDVVDILFKHVYPYMFQRATDDINRPICMVFDILMFMGLNRAAKKYTPILWIEFVRCQFEGCVGNGSVARVVASASPEGLSLREFRAACLCLDIPASGVRRDLRERVMRHFSLVRPTTIPVVVLDCIRRAILSGSNCAVIGVLNKYYSCRTNHPPSVQIAFKKETATYSKSGILTNTIALYRKYDSFVAFTDAVRAVDGVCVAEKCSNPRSLKCQNRMCRRCCRSVLCIVHGHALKLQP